MSQSTDHPTGGHSPAPRPADAPWVQPLPLTTVTTVWAPPLTVATAAAHRALDATERMDLNRQTDLAISHGNLAAALRAVLGAVDAGAPAQPSAAEIRSAAIMELADQAHLFVPGGAVAAIRKWLTAAARMAPAAPAGECTRGGDQADTVHAPGLRDRIDAALAAQAHAWPAFTSRLDRRNLAEALATALCGPAGKDTRDAAQAAAGESTQADGPCWAYRAEQTTTAGDRPMLSYGTRAALAGPPVEFAIDVAARVRIEHSYYTGPLTVHCWPAREDEHYRLPVPDGAAHFHFAAVQRTGAANDTTGGAL